MQAIGKTCTMLYKVQLIKIFQYLLGTNYMQSNTVHENRDTLAVAPITKYLFGEQRHTYM